MIFFFSIHLCIYLSIYVQASAVPHIYLSIYLSIYLTTYLPTYLPTYLYIYLSTYLLIYLSTYLSIYLCSAVQHIYLSTIATEKFTEVNIRSVIFLSIFNNTCIKSSQCRPTCIHNISNIEI